MGQANRIVSYAWPQKWQTTKGDGLPHNMNSIAPKSLAEGAALCARRRRSFRTLCGNPLG